MATGSSGTSPKDGFTVAEPCAVRVPSLWHCHGNPGRWEVGWPADVPQALTAMSSKDLKFISSDNVLEDLVQHKSCLCGHTNSSKFASCHFTSVVEFLAGCSICPEIGISCSAWLSRKKNMN